VKILVLQDWLRSGGTERQSVLLTRSFRAAGHETELITFRPGGRLAESAADLRPRSLQPFDFRWDWFAPGLMRAVREAQPNILLAMGRMANCHLRRAAKALPRGAKAVATFRTGKSLPYLFRRSLHAADAVVANSQEAAANLAQLYAVPAAKVTAIYNGLVFPETPAAATRPDTKIFLCVAMFRREKNQAGLIRLMGGLAGTSGWELWLAGDGPCRPECERLAARLGLGERVKFLGFQRDPTALYAAADAAVHASTSEALSNFLIEAQAHGLPAIACQAQGVGECFIPDETGWIVPPGDPAAFAAAARRVLELTGAERAALRRRASAFARERFDPARQTQAYLDLFARLA
jgi:glycosyltransferase involved in cell wall biosynthesis